MLWSGPSSTAWDTGFHRASHERAKEKIGSNKRRKQSQNNTATAKSPMPASYGYYKRREPTTGTGRRAPEAVMVVPEVARYNIVKNGPEDPTADLTTLTTLPAMVSPLAEVPHNPEGFLDALAPSFLLQGQLVPYQSSHPAFNVDNDAHLSRESVPPSRPNTARGNQAEPIDLSSPKSIVDAPEIRTIQDAPNDRSTEDMKSTMLSATSTTNPISLSFISNISATCSQASLPTSLQDSHPPGTGTPGLQLAAVAPRPEATAPRIRIIIQQKIEHEVCWTTYQDRYLKEKNMAQFFEWYIQESSIQDITSLTFAFVDATPRREAQIIKLAGPEHEFRRLKKTIGRSFQETQRNVEGLVSFDIEVSVTGLNLDIDLDSGWGF